MGAHQVSQRRPTLREKISSFLFAEWEARMPTRHDRSGERAAASIDEEARFSDAYPAVDRTKEAALLAAAIDDLAEVRVGDVFLWQHICYVSHLLCQFVLHMEGHRFVFPLLAEAHRAVQVSELKEWIRQLERSRR
jgi:hypothetical protein